MIDRAELPGPGPTAHFDPPTFRQGTLPNGAAVWLAPHRRAPVLSLRLLVPAGSAADPIGDAGLAALTADLLDEGTVDRTAVELHKQLMSLGAHLSIVTSADATIISLTTLARHARRALALLADVVARPRFDPGECERVRDLRVSRIEQLRQVPSAVADRVFLERLYDGHPYGHVAIGTSADLGRARPPAIEAFHRREYHPVHWTLVAAGDLAEAELEALAADTIGAVTWPSSADEATELVPVPPEPAQRLVLVPRRGAVQSEIRLGQVGVARRSADYHALLVLNAVLGGQFVSRLNMNLRERHGYTYGAHSSFDARVEPGPFTVHTSVQASATAQALREAIAEIVHIRGERPVTEPELVMARAALTRGFPRRFETASQLTHAGATLALHRLPPDESGRFVSRIERIEPEGLQAAAVAHLRPDALVAVVVGPPDVEAGLESIGLGRPALVD